MTRTFDFYSDKITFPMCHQYENLTSNPSKSKKIKINRVKTVFTSRLDSSSMAGGVGAVAIQTEAEM